MSEEANKPIVVTATATEAATSVDPNPTAEQVATETADTVTEISKAAEAAEGTPPTETPPEPSSDTQDTGAASGIDAIIQASGLTRETIEQEFSANNGTMSDETVSKLAEPLRALLGDGAEQTVRDHFAGLYSQHAAGASALYSDVGGADGFQELAQWAQSNLSKADVEAFNRQSANAHAAGDLEGQKDAIAQLKSKRDAAIGTDPKVVIGDTGGDNLPVGRPINSVVELSRIQGTPEYAESEAFRAEVEARVRSAQVRGTWKG